MGLVSAQLHLGWRYGGAGSIVFAAIYVDTDDIGGLVSIKRKVGNPAALAAAFSAACNFAEEPLDFCMSCVRNQDSELPASPV